MSDVDLVVAGAGGGLAGALRAAELGLDVLVVEAHPHFLRGNNTAMSTAMIPGAGSRFQRAAGIEDSPGQFVDDIHRKTSSSAEPTIARALAEVSAPLVEWLADHVGLPLELPTDFHYPGHSEPRVHSIPGRHGAALLRHLADQVTGDERIDLLMPARLAEVYPNPRGPGRGAVVQTPDGKRETITTDAILLATNGYAADPEQVQAHAPEIADAAYHGSEYSTGDALRIGASLGAASGYLDAYQGHAALSASARALVTWTTVMHGAVLVDTAGRRFGDETIGYSEYAARLAARPGSSGWLVFDERIHHLSLAFTDYRQVADTGALRSAGSIDELATVIGVDGSILRAELDEAELVASGARPADRFGRADFAGPLRPPYSAVRVVPALFHSQGGLLVDRHARVRDGADRPVPGVYAAGGAAASISGHGAAGYLAGNGLLPALGLAYLAATHLAGSSNSILNRRTDPIPVQESTR